MRKVLPLLLFSIAVSVRLILWLLTDYGVDDAFITFRYAENLAAGEGFVYNAGERVLGTTTPLFALILGLAAALGLWVPGMALALSLAAAGTIAVILYRWGQELELRHLAILAPLAYCVFSRSVIADISGMETALFTALLVGSLFAVHRKQATVSITLACLAAVTRPEGLLFLALTLGINLFRSRSGCWKMMLPMLFIVGGWFAFAWFYFGSPIPNSIPAKRALYQELWQSGFLDSMSRLLSLHTPVGWLLTALWLLGTLLLWIRRELLAVFSILALISVVLLAAGRTHIFFWYAAPFFPIALLVAMVPLREVLALGGWRQGRGARLAAVVGACALLLAGGLHLAHKISALRWEMSAYREIHQAAGYRLAAQATSAETVLAEDIGHLGYIFRGRLIDRDGLVTPAAIPYNRRQDYVRFVDSVAADWLFIAVNQPNSREICSRPQFKQQYEVLDVYKLPGANEYRLYRKSEASRRNR